MTSETSTKKPFYTKVILVLGFLTYVGMQGYLTVSPLWNWNLTPEVDDSLTYVLKSQQMVECYSKDCPALIDLRQQLFGKPGDPPPESEAYREKTLTSSRVFPVYHRLFSVVLVGLSKVSGMSLMEAYRFLWTLAPLIFGLAFAYWLSTMFGPGVVGVALFLLAFKIFPDTGLHHFVPSNLTMALTVVLWGRIISCRGWAPWSLFIGSMVLMTMHLIGVIYAVMSAMLALSLAEKRDRKRLLVAVGGVASCIVVFFLFSHLNKELTAFLSPLLPQGDFPVVKLFFGTAENIIQFFVDNVRLSEGLWGSPAIFCGALALGLVTLKQSSRRVVLKILLIYAVVLGGVMFYISNHPADVIFRLWIPLVVLLFGLVGQAIGSSMESVITWWQERRLSPSREKASDIQRFWPVIVAAVLLGYVGEMVLKGAEQVQTMARYLREKEPLALYPSQTEQLLALARPDDRVLYTSFILMDYYLIYGAMRLGAVYYHPALEESQAYSQWLTRPDLRFAVAFQPTVYHPSFEGKDEASWWMTMPDFRYSPLNERQKYGPLTKFGAIPVNLYRWLDIRVKTKEFPKTLRLYIDNPRREAVLEVVPLNQEGKPLDQFQQAFKIQPRWSGWLQVDLAGLPPDGAIRLVFPREIDKYQIKRINFGEDPHHWPWAQKALVTFYPRDYAYPIAVSFDPAALLPEKLRGRQITVLDDRGSSVLLEMKQ
ncbi:MAG: hypothetical protein WAU47_07900 [Desulfobaccales bacterium]